MSLEATQVCCQKKKSILIRRLSEVSLDKYSVEKVHIGILVNTVRESHISHLVYKVGNTTKLN